VVFEIVFELPEDSGECLLHDAIKITDINNQNFIFLLKIVSFLVSKNALFD
jgi:hypothetical protein